MTLSRKLIEKLPKTDLHCHLDGSMRIETLIDLAQQQKIKLKSYDAAELMGAMGYGRIRANLEEYLVGFDPLISVMQDAESIERIFYEVCEDAHRENIWLLEIRYCPYLHTKAGLDLSDVVKACTRAREKAQRDFSMSVGQILCGLKNDSSASILEVAKIAVKYRDLGVVGLDLAGPEQGFPIRDHLEALHFARKNHINITLHAGESCGPESIAQAILDGHAHRVGHGTSLMKDEQLLEYVVDHRIGVEACPISNCHTQAVASLDQHPIKKFLQAGVRVSINTDNRLCSDTSITEELLALIEHQEFNLEEIKKLIENGFKSAFLNFNTRKKLIREFHGVWQGLVE